MNRVTSGALRLALALALLAIPSSALAAPIAQEGTVDSATVAVIQSGAATVFAAFGGGAVIVMPVVDDTPVEEPIPEPTPEPTEEGTGGVEVGEFVEYTSPELTISFPQNWEVSEEDGGIFSASEDVTGLTLQIENFGNEVPGLFMLPVFEGQSGLFASSLGEGAEITGISRLTIGEDALPALRMTFANVSDPFAGVMDGVVYIIAAGRDGYGMYAGAESTAWQTLGPVVDEIAAGIAVNPEYVTLQRAGDEPLDVVSEDGVFSVTLPTGWFGSVTGDEDLGLVISDPDVAVVGAVGLSEVAEGDPMLQSLVEGIAGDLDDETTAAIIESVLDNMNLANDGNVLIDDSQTAVFPAATEGVLGIIRVVGEAPLDEDALMPVTLYVSVYSNRAGAFVFMGDSAAVLDHEGEILQVIESLQVLE